MFSETVFINPKIRKIVSAIVVYSAGRSNFVSWVSVDLFRKSTVRQIPACQSDLVRIPERQALPLDREKHRR